MHRLETDNLCSLFEPHPEEVFSHAHFNQVTDFRCNFKRGAAMESPLQLDLISAGGDYQYKELSRNRG
jgi:hypothetical protein